MSTTVHTTVNGVTFEQVVEDRTTLAQFLREDLLLTGTHLACEHGVCGSCTVLLDEAPVRSCLVLAVQVEGCHVSTIEGVAQGEHLHPVQQGFYERQSFQCGFCTPGFVMTTLALLREDSRADEASIREALSGNLCRCTGYQSIVSGVLRAVEIINSGVGGE